MQPLTELFRNAISEGSDTGMLIAADALEESDDTRNQQMGELLRCYVNIQTYVRTSMPIPLSLGERYNELQRAFNTKLTKSIEDSDWWNAEYYKPLGVYYLGLRVSQRTLIQMPNLISVEPVRELEIGNCIPGNDLKALLRNYRMGYMQRLTLRFGNGYYSRRTQQPGNVAEIAQALCEMLGDMMESVTVHGVDDRLKRCQVMFLSNKKIRKGCRLLIHRTNYGNPEKPDFMVTKK